MNFTQMKQTRIFDPKIDKTGLIRNPAMGWVLYIDAFGESFAPSARGKLIDAKAFWEAAEPAAQKASIFYIRAPWTDFEPEHGQYAWNINENYRALIQGALDRGLQLAFRVYMDSMHCHHQATPQWVRDLGVAGYEEASDSSVNTTSPTQWSPRLDDPIFRECFERFIGAFAQEYDDPDRVAYIDAQGLGWWGEMHHMENHIAADKMAELFHWICGAYGRAFHRVLLGDQYTHLNYDGLHTMALEEYGYIIRRDSLGSPLWFTREDKDKVLEWWPHLPVFGENCYHHMVSNPNWWGGDGFKTIRDCMRSALDDALEVHANTLDLRVLEDALAWAADNEDYVDEFIARGGYRLAPVRVQVTPLTQGAVRIEHQWRNFGVGKLPNDTRQWNLKYAVAFAWLDPQQGRILHQEIDAAAQPAHWVGSDVFSYNFEFRPSTPCPANSLLGVAVVDRSKANQPAIKLALQNAQVIDGWHILGSID